MSSPPCSFLCFINTIYVFFKVSSMPNIGLELMVKNCMFYRLSQLDAPLTTILGEEKSLYYLKICLPALLCTFLQRVDLNVQVMLFCSFHITGSLENSLNWHVVTVVGYFSSLKSLWWRDVYCLALSFQSSPWWRVSAISVLPSFQSFRPSIRFLTHLFVFLSNWC